MSGPDRTGDPGVDALIDAHAAQRRQLHDTLAVSAAEGTVTSARIQQLADDQAAAWRRIPAAKGRLTRARRTGDPAAIAAAEKHLAAVETAAEDLADAAIPEMHRLVEAKLSDLSQVNAQIRRTWNAGDAVIDALESGQPDSREPGDRA